MEFNSAICTTEEQSKRLLDLGLKADTADMSYRINYFDFDGVLLECVHTLEPDPPLNNDRFIPAWSLHRLIEIAQLPQSWQCVSGDWYNEVIATIQSKIHIGELNKEYLEEKICGH